MAYTNHSFCWHGVISTDTEKAKSFYTAVLPWTIITAPMGDEVATMFAASDIPRAHCRAPQMEGVPSHWSNYLRVEDVNAATAAAIANGGQQLVPPTDIPPGRFSVITSPSGAAVCLFHEADPASSNTPAGPGSVHWVELHSTDLAADVSWLKASFGITTEEMAMPDGPYLILKSGDHQVGGAMAAQMPGAPSMWLTWIQVTDVDATVASVGTNGGQVLGPLMEVPGVGRMAVVQDPTGGVFGVITPPAA